MPPITRQKLAKSSSKKVKSISMKKELNQNSTSNENLPIINLNKFNSNKKRIGKSILKKKNDKLVEESALSKDSLLNKCASLPQLNSLNLSINQSLTQNSTNELSSEFRILKILNSHQKSNYSTPMSTGIQKSVSSESFTIHNFKDQSTNSNKKLDDFASIKSNFNSSVSNSFNPTIDDQLNRFNSTAINQQSEFQISSKNVQSSIQNNLINNEASTNQDQTNAFQMIRRSPTNKQANGLNSSNQDFQMPNKDPQFPTQNHSFCSETNNRNFTSLPFTGNHLILKLDWSTRDLLISNLNQFSSLLLGRKVLSTTKELVRKSDELLKIITELTIKRSTKPTELNIESIKKKRKLSENQINLNKNETSVEIFFDLPSSIRNRILCHLTNNKMFANLMNNDSVEIKDNDLVDENNHLITELMNLRHHVVQIENNTNDHVLIDENNEKFSDDLNKLASKVDQLITSNKFLKNDLASLKKTVYSQSEIVYDFEINDAGSFLRLLDKRESNQFYCQNVPWSFKVRLDEKENYMSVYCRCDSDFKNTNFVYRAHFDIKLKAQSLNKAEKVSSFIHLYAKKSGFGIPKFIQIDQLIDPKNDFVKDDRIWFQIYLKCDKLVGNVE